MYEVPDIAEWQENDFKVFFDAMILLQDYRREGFSLTESQLIWSNTRNLLTEERGYDDMELISWQRYGGWVLSGIAKLQLAGNTKSTKPVAE